MSELFIVAAITAGKMKPLMREVGLLLSHLAASDNDLLLNEWSSAKMYSAHKKAEVDIAKDGRSQSILQKQMDHNVTLQQTLNVQATTTERLQKDLGDEKMQNMNLKFEKENIKTENNHLKIEKEGLETKKKILQSENNNLKTEKENIKTEKKNLKTENNHLKIEKEGLETKKMILESENNNLKTEKENINIEKNNLETENNNLKTEKEIIKTQNENLKTENERLEQDLTDQKVQNENTHRQRLDHEKRMSEQLLQGQAAISNLTNVVNDMNFNMTMIAQMVLQVQMNQRMNGLPIPAAGALTIGSPMRPLAAIKGSEGFTSTSSERTATAKSEGLVTTTNDKSNDEVPNDDSSTSDGEELANDDRLGIVNDVGQVDIIEGPQESGVAAGDVTISF
ncbi:hypothetical protein B0O80DRAFT_499295 [Mortierella sp. GBAus27b]|nr:hypothetical protein B0O80DRAFT_499295 [Mortierella sp. GBAus27b]